MLSMSVRPLDNNFRNSFSLFQLESKSYRNKQCWPYISYYIDFFLDFFTCIYKNLHIEPFNYTIKIVCFGFGSTNVGSSVIKTLKKIIIAIFWPPKSEFDLVPIQKFLCCRSQNISCWAKCLVPYQKLICI
jgi:hypothetical protein